jgi:predicted site-specific integrase-resolvase
MPIPRLLTPAEAASSIGVKTSTLSLWRSTGRYGLKYVKVGRLIMYLEEDVEAFIKSRVFSHVGQYGRHKD